MKEPYATKIDPSLKQALKDLSIATKTPQARLVEEALRDLIKKYEEEGVLDLSKK